jgi:hypothetical protein
MELVNKRVKIITDSGIIKEGVSLYGDFLGGIYTATEYYEEEGIYVVETPKGTIVVYEEDCLSMPEDNKRKEKHYELWPGHEAFDVMKATLSHEEFIGFLKGNILKYQLRIGNKESEPVEKDLQKINTYKQILKETL